MDKVDDILSISGFIKKKCSAWSFISVTLFPIYGK